MVLWQGILIIAVTVGIAGLCGIMFGRFLSHRWPSSNLRKYKIAEPQNEPRVGGAQFAYSEGQTYFAVQGTINEGTLARDNAEQAARASATPSQTGCRGKSQRIRNKNTPRSRTDRPGEGRKRCSNPLQTRSRSETSRGRNKNTPRNRTHRPGKQTGSKG